ncbi:MAG: CAP domain-containing protein [Myxococcales bacterium]|nr:CAP domain-containing protein [Myxococcales bacterium]
MLGPLPSTPRPGSRARELATLGVLALALASTAGCGKGDDEVGPGDDPCSGNPFTPTAARDEHGAAPPDSTPDQLTALAEVDAFRNLVGLAPIDFVAALNHASQAHSDYCAAAPGNCPNWHDEVPGNPGFTGADFGTRAQAAGYTGSASFEVMASGVGPVGAVRMWVDSVYHRTPFVSPAIHEAGYGGSTAFDTMDFGCCGPADPTFVTNYPVHGQTGVTSSFGGNEGPEPPVPPSGWPSGSIVSVVFPPSGAVSVTKHELYDAACNPVDHLAGGKDVAPDPGFVQGFLGSTVVLYAHAPLAPGQTYTANVEYTLDGVAGNRTFQFTVQ